MENLFISESNELVDINYIRDINNYSKVNQIRKMSEVEFLKLDIPQRTTLIILNNRTSIPGKFIRNNGNNNIIHIVDAA